MIAVNRLTPIKLGDIHESLCFRDYLGHENERSCLVPTYFIFTFTNRHAERSYNVGKTRFSVSNARNFCT